ncbi:MAG: NHL repeat containing protein [bacterium]|nr:MAG: NHL repeat containing protein [bacterium]
MNGVRFAVRLLWLILFEGLAIPGLAVGKLVLATFAVHWLAAPAFAVEPVLVRTIRTPAAGSNSICYQIGMTVDETSGRFYLVDRLNNRVDMFDREGTHTGSWGGLGSGPGQFNDPTDIVQTSTGELLITDWKNHRIQVFGFDGTFIRQWGSFGTGPGQFDSPVGIAVDRSGFVYVVDSWLSRVQKFTLGGQYVTQWGSRGREPGQFLSCTGVAVGPAGEIVIADQGNDRLQVFDNVGTLLGLRQPSSPAVVRSPVGVHIDSNGKIYVAGWGGNMLCFDASGQTLLDWNSRIGACRIITNAAGEMFVSGFNAGEILVYAFPTSVQPTTWSGIKTLLD